ncbi:MAG: bifunctional folylpolyglutamate synthase/dihydrofolate synthase [Lachnospiraceae bacterium]|nr:bifunctional folylpolyglutamate synthase/dihydrofolate synthase [Lachnospiraceae bacterium]
MTQKQLEEYLEELNSLGRVPGLDNITRLCRKLGDPQNDLCFIHIAGTNGKGSVGAFLSAVFTEAGLKAGRYISPTIREYRERFMVGDKMISQSLLLELMDEVKEACDAITGEGYPHPTAFEAETALSFLFYRRKNCDLVLLECGMGGLLDATNVVSTALMEILTPIGADHKEFLGDTLEKIAEQKAGIIKEGSLAVSAKQEEGVLSVIRDICRAKNVPLYVCDDADISEIKHDLKRQSFRYKSKHKLTIQPAGLYQIDNAHLAALALDVLMQAGKEGKAGIFDKTLTKLQKKLDWNVIKRGLAKAVWQVRFQVVSTDPMLILDGAHNRPAAARLAETIKFYFPNRRIIYIMGLFRDKDAEGILQETARLARQIITVRLPDAQRSEDPLRLAKLVTQYNPNVTTADSVAEAVEMARLLAGPEGVVIAFGSLSYLGQILDIREREAGKKVGRKRG